MSKTMSKILDELSRDMEQAEAGCQLRRYFLEPTKTAGIDAKRGH